MSFTRVPSYYLQVLARDNPRHVVLVVRHYEVAQPHALEETVHAGQGGVLVDDVGPGVHVWCEVQESLIVVFFDLQGPGGEGERRGEKGGEGGEGGEGEGRKERRKEVSTVLVLEYNTFVSRVYRPSMTAYPAQQQHVHTHYRWGPWLVCSPFFPIRTGHIELHVTHPEKKEGRGRRRKEEEGGGMRRKQCK